MGCVSSDLDSRVKATKPARETRNAMNRNFVYSPSKGVEKITARAPAPRPPQDYPFCLAGEK